MVLIDDFILVHNDMQAFDDFVVNNLYGIINFIRHNYEYTNDSEKEIKYQFYNDLISRLKNALRNNDDEFYKQQFNERGIYLDYKFNIDKFIMPEQLRDEVRCSLSFDNFFYDILTKRIENVSQSEKEMLTMNTLFLYSVNFFVLECPNILDKNLLLKYVLLENKKIFESFKFRLGLNHEYEKTNCLVKSSKQFLKEFGWS